MDTYPAFPRYSEAEPGRHNVTVWPLTEGFWADAAAHAGDQARFASEMESLAELADSSGEFYEAYNAFAPTLPAGWGNVTLTGVQYRGATLNIDLQGSGNVVSSFTVDGTPAASDSIPATLTGTHTVSITLTGGQSSAVTGEAGLCMDVSGASTSNGTPVSTAPGTQLDIWDRNDGANQIWTLPVAA